MAPWPPGYFFAQVPFSPWTQTPRALAAATCFAKARPTASLVLPVRAAVSGWASARALGFFAQLPETRSDSVTTITVPPGTDVDALRQVARERFQVSIAGALGPLSGRGFRIGHMGDQNPVQILGALAGVQAALQVRGIAHGADGVQRAIEFLAR